MTKDEIRKTLRQVRREHVETMPENMRGLVFHRPPAPLLELIPNGANIGLYRANPFEAPAASYGRFFFERGHELALPRFASRDAPMEFARFVDPFNEEDLEVGPFGMLEPSTDAPACVPEVLIMPLVGFTGNGERLGQGGGHYDRWLAGHRNVVAIALAWDCQKVDELPLEPHDQPITAIVTPTRIYGPFE